VYEVDSRRSLDSSVVRVTEVWLEDRSFTPHSPLHDVEFDALTPPPEPIMLILSPPELERLPPLSTSNTSWE